MDALRNDANFDDILSRVADIMRASAPHAIAPASTPAAIPKPAASGSKNWLTIFAMVAGVFVGAAVTFATGYLALISEEPGIWIHRLMALAVLQSLLAAAAVTHFKPFVEKRNLSVRIAGPEKKLPIDPRAASLPQVDLPPPPPVIPRRPMVAGTLAGREYLKHGDGTIEIDTLLGRRRFVSIEAAREFVGA